MHTTTIRNLRSAWQLMKLLRRGPVLLTHRDEPYAAIVPITNGADEEAIRACLAAIRLNGPRVVVREEGERHHD